ncbi:MAG: CarD family transcriptional regulator [Kiritimatiellia bacterium]
MPARPANPAPDDAPPRAFPGAAADAEFCQPLELALRQGLECETQELSSSAAAWTAWALAGRTRRTVLIVADGPRTLEALVQDLHTLRPFADAALLHYPGWEALPEAGARINPDLAGDRLQTLLRLREPSEAPRVVATDIQAVMLRTWKPEALARSLLTLRRGGDHPLEAVTEHLAEHGYGFATEVLAKGEAAKRGGLLDLWPPDLAWPVRVEYFGDTVESIRHFDPATQRSLDPLDTLRIAPVSDAAQPGGGEMADLFDFVPADAVWLWLDPAQITHHAGIHEETLRDANAAHLGLTRDDVIARAARHPQIHLGASGRRLHVAELEVRPLDALPGMGTGNLLPDLLDQERMKIVSRLCHEAAQGGHVVFLMNTPGSHDRFVEGYLKRVQPPPGKRVESRIGMIQEGFALPAAGLTVVAESDLFGVRKQARAVHDPHSRIKRGARGSAARVTEFSDLQPGELVVHVDHGIGRYLGLREIESSGVKQECLSVEYAGGALVHLPVSQAHLLGKYVGVGNALPDLHTLGGKRWHKEKEDAVASVRDLASSMLETQARRQSLPGHAFKADTPWQHDFEAMFPYQETVDQESAITAVKADMENTRPMDRLVCGDVGYGKTEVAMRAAFKAVMEGKQVAMLVPTTILAQQHYESFRERMAAFPVTIEMLSRFRGRAQQAEIIKRLRAGTLDIVIGTHRLVQRDVGFHDLGLVIIDEEQRFGVEHKERLKQLRELVDVLTLTATPIPRTLYLSMTGARDMSVIQTPPRERLPIATFVRPWDDEVVRKAILRELNREGQVFFLHNRVATIQADGEAPPPSRARGPHHHRPRPDGRGPPRTRHARLHRRQVRPPPLHHHHRERRRHPQRQHHLHRPRRPFRPGRAVPAPRPRGPLQEQGLRLPDHARGGPAPPRLPPAHPRHPALHQPRRGLQAGPARPRDPRRRQHARRRAERPHHQHRFRPLPLLDRTVAHLRGEKPKPVVDVSVRTDFLGHLPRRRQHPRRLFHPRRVHRGGEPAHRRLPRGGGRGHDGRGRDPARRVDRPFRPAAGGGAQSPGPGPRAGCGLDPSRVRHRGPREQAHPAAPRPVPAA